MNIDINHIEQRFENLVNPIKKLETNVKTFKLSVEQINVITKALIRLSDDFYTQKEVDEMLIIENLLIMFGVK